MTAEAQVSSQPVLMDTLEAGVMTLTLNRPERLNALNAALIEALSAGIERAAAEPGCRAVLMTGAGRGFCAGADLANRAFAPGEARPDLGQALEKRNQSADPRDPQSPEADRLRGQRPGCGGRSQYRACLRHRAGGEIGKIPAGLRAHRPHSRRGRHLDPAASRGRRARPRAHHAGRADRRGRRRCLGDDLSRRRR